LYQYLIYLLKYSLHTSALNKVQKYIFQKNLLFF